MGQTSSKVRIDGLKGYYISKNYKDASTAQREFEYMVNIDHPNIISYKYFMKNIDTSEAQLITEYIDGPTLK